MLTVDDDDFGVWCAGVEQLRRRRSSRMWCWTRRNMMLAEAEVYNGAVIITIKAAGAGVLKLLHYYTTTTTTPTTCPHTVSGISMWQLLFGGRKVLTYHSWRVRRTGIHLIKQSVCNPYVVGLGGSEWMETDSPTRKEVSIFPTECRI